VRITDVGDRLVYHKKNKRQLFPTTGSFWRQIGLLGD
jgi:hypothetical protein